MKYSLLLLLFLIGCGGGTNHQLLVMCSPHIQNNYLQLKCGKHIVETGQKISQVTPTTIVVPLDIPRCNSVIGED